MNEAVAEASPRVADTLRVSEIFWSIQGETTRAGLPTAFVRLTGCPLRCTYCDTAYAFSGGSVMPLSAILDQVAATGAHYVTVTGGEPLAQPRCLDLLRRLCDSGYDVSLETSGALPVDAVDPRVCRILDLKTPASGEQSRNLWSNLDVLTAHDQIKFVMADRNDYEWVRQIIAQYQLAGRCELLLSPVHGQLAPADLARWMLEDHLPARLQLQLHKLMWGDARGR
ncbi:MAG: 7-carboxy-7-deazaguanine synthase QueE [Gammaproteobacteria bacterium]|nr:7-carboxy-7-deazaguanine synthase QueE [Gammaproteobacteria bacterium]